VFVFSVQRVVSRTAGGKSTAGGGVEGDSVTGFWHADNADFLSAKICFICVICVLFKKFFDMLVYT
jgi:hypothetical protein